MCTMEKGSDSMQARSKMYYYAEDIVELLGVSRNYAYKVIRELNDELEQQGYRVVSGKIPKKFFQERFYGFDPKVESPGR